MYADTPLVEPRQAFDMTDLHHTRRNDIRLARKHQPMVTVTPDRRIVAVE
jgi:hypothetical protein